jgi:hypothetical protein
LLPLGSLIHSPTSWAMTETLTLVANSLGRLRQGCEV